MGDLDEFRSEAALRIVERMRGIRVRRVRATNHLIGKRLARAVAQTVLTQSPSNIAKNEWHSRSESVKLYPSQPTDTQIEKGN